MAAGDIERVYVHAPDRLARRYAHQVLLMEEFRRAGAEVVFLNRPIGGTAEDDLLLQIQGVIAEYERAKILERSRRGRRHAARSGLVSAFTTAPFGYRYVTKDQGGGVARFEVVPEEARMVRLIFAWVGLERLSLREVCRRLQQAGCPHPARSTRWYASTIRGMLANTAYIGRAVYGHRAILPGRPRLRPIRGRIRSRRRRPTARVTVPREEWIEVPVPALVDPAVFEAAQVQLREPSAQAGPGHGPRWLLQGLTVCRRCGYAYYGKTAPQVEAGSREGRVLPLPLHRHRRVSLRWPAVCDNPPVRGDRLEQAVWDRVRALLEEPERVADEYHRRLTSPRPHRQLTRYGNSTARSRAAAWHRPADRQLRRGGDRPGRVQAPHRRPEGAAARLEEQRRVAAEAAASRTGVDPDDRPARRVCHPGQ